jgi:predicted Fe-S protein YdhL (DUF1289 family)
MSISSPCISVCVLDEADLCLGCGRTRAEIAGWIAMSEATRLSIMDQLATRLASRREASGAPSTADATGGD